ncbi:HAD-IIA family hydrolase [Patescibacteria group bacterium]
MSLFFALISNYDMLDPMPKMLEQIKGFLVDLDGTTYLSGTALPGAVDFFQLLKKQQIPCLFFSNNPSKHVDEYVKKITQLGLPVTAKNILTSTQATTHYLKDNELNRVYTVGTPGFEEEVKQAGVNLVKADEQPDALVISFDTTLTYDKLQQAALLLHHNPELPYIATNPDLVCPTADGPIPDCGSLIALLKAATNREPVVIGKPNEGMVHLANKRLGLPPEDLAVIGDRLYTDMKMGHDHGLTTILVLSGETNKEDLSDAPWQPDFIFKDLAELYEQLHPTQPLQ